MSRHGSPISTSSRDGIIGTCRLARGLGKFPCSTQLDGDSPQLFAKGGFALEKSISQEKKHLSYEAFLDSGKLDALEAVR